MSPCMFTPDDLVDAILEELLPRFAGAGPARGAPRSGAPAPPQTPRWKPDPGPRGRPFLTEYDVKKALTPGSRHLTIPKDAIVSPLALDWLALKGIELVHE